MHYASAEWLGQFKHEMRMQRVEQEGVSISGDKKHLEQHLEEGTPNWMTKERRTILIQKDKKQGNAANRYVPFNLRGSTNLVLPKARTNLYGVDTVRFVGQKLW